MNWSNNDLKNLDECMNSEPDELHMNFISRLSHDLTVLNVNLRGLKSNFGLLKTFLSRIHTTIKVIVVTESRLDNKNAHLYNLSGYKQCLINRPTLGGGLIAFVHSSLEFSIIKELTGIYPSHESLAFVLKCPNKVDINFLCTYTIGA